MSCCTDLRSLAGVCLCLFFVVAVNADDRPAVARSGKLFPQSTDGIYNAQGQQVMNCQIGSDGLTVTDQAWHTYLPKGKSISDYAVSLYIEGYKQGERL